MKEILFRFNPFTVAEWSNDQIKEQYDVFAKNLMEGDSPMELSTNIDLYANMGYLIGEMIARYSRDVDDMEAQLKVDIANTISKERIQWLKDNADKPPAMSFFENRALSMNLIAMKDLNEKEAFRKRFKYAYDSIQDKQNALKKKLESVRYEIGGR